MASLDLDVQLLCYSMSKGQLRMSVAKIRPTRWDGRAVFLWRNIRTNQVIYSLTSTLDEAEAKKQLTFYGKKTVPAEIRKDVWRPYATVAIPRLRVRKSRQVERLQQLQLDKLAEFAYRKLLHLRMLRDYAWRQDGGPVAVTEERIKRTDTSPMFEKRLVKKRSHERREAKKDLKERQKFLMDQRGSSAADLATVIDHLNIYVKEKLELPFRSPDAPIENFRVQTPWRSNKRFVYSHEIQRRFNALLSWGRNATQSNLDRLQLRIDQATAKLNKQSSPQEKKRVMQMRQRRNYIIRARRALQILRQSYRPETEEAELNKTLHAPSGMNEIQTNSKTSSLSNVSEAQSIMETKTATVAQGVEDNELWGLPPTNQEIDSAVLSTPWRHLINDIKALYSKSLRLYRLENPDKQLPVHIFWADLFNRKYTNTWAENAYHHELGHLHSQDLRRGALPPFFPDKSLAIETDEFTNSLERSVKLKSDQSRLKFQLQQKAELTNTLRELVSLFQYFQEALSTFDKEESIYNALKLDHTSNSDPLTSFISIQSQNRSAILTQLFAKQRQSRLYPRRSDRHNAIMHQISLLSRRRIALDKSLNRAKQLAERITAQDETADPDRQLKQLAAHRAELEAKIEKARNQKANIEAALRDLNEDIEENKGVDHIKITRAVYKGNQGIDDEIKIDGKIPGEEEDATLSSPPTTRSLPNRKPILQEPKPASGISSWIPQWANPFTWGRKQGEVRHPASI